jgi:hypothetical protein
MLKLKKEEALYLSEKDYPYFRMIFQELTTEYDFPIYSYEEEGGELQINIHNSFIIDLKRIIEEGHYSVEFKNYLIKLIELIENNPDISVFYYK